MRHFSGSAVTFVAAVLLLVSAPAAQAQQPSAKDILRALPARNIGPTSMGGRVSDLAVYEKEPRIFYVAASGGGLWRTDNGGMTFDCVFQYETSVALGAVAVDQSDPNHVWVGTGEQNSRNTTQWGDGVYETKDGGKTWVHHGLENTKQISQIILDPKDKNTIYVGALGQLWGSNPERGLFKSTDGGKTWNKILFVDDKTGVIDLVMSPKDPKTLWVAMWQRDRKAYQFASGGPGSGLYKTTDGGKSFHKITKGMPEGELGRIGLDVLIKDPKVLIATIEAGKPDDKGQMRASGGFFKSTDGGESWERLSGNNPRPFYFSIPRFDQQDPDRIYVPGVSMTYSEDGGKNFRTFNTSVHVDHHAMWIDPNDGNHMIIGEDGGCAQTRDRGVKWEHLNSMPIGQYYQAAVDMRKPYWIFGGLQDNGTWGIPTQTTNGAVTHFDSHFINGGDGFYAQVDPTDWRIVYAESQGGAIARHNIETGEQRFIRPNSPPAAQGEQREVYRFNWNTPYIISPHNPHTLWLGGNKLFKSVDQGDSWVEASPDLTTDDKDKQNPRAGVSPEDTGAERYCTITTISESSRKAGIVWVGTDDGNVQLTVDDGKTWTNLTANFPGVPKNTWVSRVVASHFNTARAFVAFDGHRNNDYKPYLFMTDDYGKTWTPINAGFGDESVYAVCEGTQNSNLLIVGTEMGLYFSLDRGKTYTKFQKDNAFPTVRVDDVLIHPRELDAVIATHGRSIWTIPVGALEQLDSATMDKDVAVLKPATMYGLGKIYDGWYEGDRVWSSPNTQPGAQIFFYAKADSTEKATVRIESVDGNALGTVQSDVKAGLNYVYWRPRGRGANQMETGDYRIVVKIGDKEYTSVLHYEDVADQVPH